MKMIFCTLIICASFITCKAMDVGIIGSTSISVEDYNSLVDKVNEQEERIGVLERDMSKAVVALAKLLEKLDTPTNYEQLAHKE